jgi:hypothetical protein
LKLTDIDAKTVKLFDTAYTRVGADVATTIIDYEKTHCIYTLADAKFDYLKFIPRYNVCQEGTGTGAKFYKGSSPKNLASASAITPYANLAGPG